MRITTKSEYALISLLDIIKNSNGNAVSLRDIAKRQKISIDYLEQLFKTLKDKNIVQSFRGPRGGYMVKDPQKITILQIVTSVNDEPTYEMKSESSSQEALKVASLFSMIDHTFLEELKNVTLSQLS